MPNKFAILKRKYLSSFPAKLEGIIGAQKNQDVDLVHDLIHKLAGSSGGYGFDEISLHCKSILLQLHKSNNKTTKDIEKSIEQLLILLSTAK
jgi:HPt (histidine-containing phosphotransfer) domain-containing protein